MVFFQDVPSPHTGAPIFASVIAEEALALSAAFLMKDAGEMRFRTTLLLTYALDIGQAPLVAASVALLKEVSDGSGVQQHMAHSFEQVISAAADMLSA